MTIDRYYTVEAVIRVPIDHEFPEPVRQDCYLRLKGETTTSALVMEQIRQMLENAGLPIESLSTGLRDWRVTDEQSGVILREIPNQEIPPKQYK
ncbi:MAG: hypothetical protein EBU84_19840 [Actinobacteria bacterium]|nr:hypothetical protein [Actinomycetota bacterium]